MRALNCANAALDRLATPIAPTKKTKCATPIPTQIMERLGFSSCKRKAAANLREKARIKTLCLILIRVVPKSHVMR